MSFSWQDLSALPNPSLARTFANMVYDPVNDRIVYFGGDAFNETWFIVDGIWSLQVPASSPGARRGHSMFWDPINNKVVLFGGLLGANYLDDLWSFDGITWTQEIADGDPGNPNASWLCAMAANPNTGKALMFGGTAPGNFTLAETWELDLASYAWTQKTPATTPNQRRMHEMMWDTANNRITMFRGHGGTVPTGPRYTLWTWDSTDWTDRTPAPGNDMTRDDDHAYGDLFNLGASGQLYFVCTKVSPVEFWRLAVDFSAWTKLTTSGGSPSQVTSDDVAVYDSADGFIYLESRYLDPLFGYRTGIWRLSPPAAPLVTPVDPTKSQSGVSSAVSVNFTLTSELTIQTPWTVEIDRGGADGFELALTYNGSAVFEPLFQGPDSLITILGNGFDITIDPQSPFMASQVVQVRITAQDNLGQDATV